MATLTSIQKQIAVLEKQAEAIRKSDARSAAMKAKELIVRHNLTAEDVGLGGKPGKKFAAKKTDTTKLKTVGIAKYRDPKTGKTWTGNGKAPGWIAGKKNRDAFLINAANAPAVVETTPTAAPVKRAASKKAAVKKASTKKAVTAPEVVDAVAETIKAAAPKKTAGLKAGKADKPASAASPVKKPVTRAAPAKKAAAAAAEAEAEAEATSGSLSETVVAAAPTEAPAA